MVAQCCKVEFSLSSGDTSINALILLLNNSNLAYILSRTVSEIWQIIGQIIAVDRGVPLCSAFVSVNS